VADIDGEAAERVAASIGAASAVAVKTDVADLESCRAAAEAALSAFGRIDGLVNNAALFSRIPVNRGRFDEIDPAEWDRVMEVNVKGTWQMCLAVVPAMEERAYGKIVNVSSGTALKGSAGRSHYVTSKAAVLGLTKSLAWELGASGIRVNAIAPGNTLSEDDPDDETLGRRKAAANRRALPLVETPADLVGTVAYLLSPDSDFLTGQTIVVDGGGHMH
jgi:3-oxoacyl-[acyl-carrier protein] reductase